MPCSRRRLLYLRLCRRGRDDTVTSVCGGEGGLRLSPVCNISQSSSVKVVNNCDRDLIGDRTLGRSSVCRSRHCHHLDSCQIQFVWIWGAEKQLLPRNYSLPMPSFSTLFCSVWHVYHCVTFYLRRHVGSVWLLKLSESMHSRPLVRK